MQPSQKNKKVEEEGVVGWLGWILGFWDLLPENGSTQGRRMEDGPGGYGGCGYGEVSGV